MFAEISKLRAGEVDLRTSDNTESDPQSPLTGGKNQTHKAFSALHMHKHTPHTQISLQTEQTWWSMPIAPLLRRAREEESKLGANSGDSAAEACLACSEPWAQSLATVNKKKLLHLKQH